MSSSVKWAQSHLLQRAFYENWVRFCGSHSEHTLWHVAASQGIVVLVILEIVLQTGGLVCRGQRCLFFSPSALPWTLPCLLFSFFLPQLLVSTFFSPTHNSERVEEDRLIWRLNSTLTLRKNKPWNTLYYHTSAIFKQSLSAWTENYRPAGRDKLEGLPVWTRNGRQLAGPCLWEGEAQLLAVCADFTQKIALPCSFHRQENNIAIW